MATVSALKRNLNFQPFVPRRGFANAHVQTLAGHFQSHPDPPPSSESRFVEAEKGVRILCHANWQPERRRAATAVVLHGLAGSSESPRVVGMARKAWDRGMNVVRMNMRNCGGTEALTPTLFHSGLSGDVGAVVSELIARDGLERIVLAGYSMGANMILKLLGEWAETAPSQVAGAVVVSPLIDLAPSAQALHSGWNRIYERHFVRELCRLYRRKAKLFPAIYDVRRLEGIRGIYDFDDRIIGPCGGFLDAEDYYERARSSRVVDQIRVPALVIHAKDDPFIRILPSTRARLAANPAIEFIETAHGGHCGFLAARDGTGDDGRWAERLAVDFLAAV